MYLIFDTETTGLPDDWNAPPSDTENWKRIVQLSWCVLDENGKLKHTHDYIIKPIGFTIPRAASKIHGITYEKALKKGVPFEAVFMMFINDLAICNIIVGHNLQFDVNMVLSECYRHNLPTNIFDKKQKVCTMKSTVDLLKIKNSYGYKYPTLQELHKYLFGKGFDGAHNSLEDVKATANCFYMLKKLKLI